MKCKIKYADLKLKKDHALDFFLFSNVNKKRISRACGRRGPILQLAEIQMVSGALSLCHGNKVENVCENLLVCNNNKLSLHKFAAYFVAISQRAGDDKI